MGYPPDRDPAPVFWRSTARFPHNFDCLRDGATYPSSCDGHTGELREAWRDRIVRGTERAADVRRGDATMIDTGYDPVTVAAALRCVGGGNPGIDRSTVHNPTAHDPTASRIAALPSNACRIR